MRYTFVPTSDKPTPALELSLFYGLWFLIVLGLADSLVCDREKVEVERERERKRERREKERGTVRRGGGAGKSKGWLMRTALPGRAAVNETYS